VNQSTRFIKEKRNRLNHTKVELAETAGIALTFIRKIEQGKYNLYLAEVSLVILMFGHALKPVNS